MQLKLVSSLYEFRGDLKTPKADKKLLADSLYLMRDSHPGRRQELNTAAQDRAVVHDYW